MSKRLVVDVVVVGGGMVGSTFASLLSKSVPGLRVALVDPLQQVEFNHQSLTNPPDMRVSAISPSSARVLESCGAWQKLNPARMGRYEDMIVWDWFSRGKIRFSAEELDRDQEKGKSTFVSGVSEPLGYIVENNAIQAALQDTLDDRDVEWIQSKVVDISFDDVDCFGMGEQKTARGPARIKLDSDVTVEAQLLVGADGARSVVKKHCSIGSIGVDYSQRGVVATVELKSPSKTAYQRFLPLGPLAVLPSFGNFASIVWTTSVSHSRELLKMSDLEFLMLLNKSYTAKPEHFGRASGRWNSILPENFQSLLGVLFGDENFEAPQVTKLVSKRAAFPLQIQQSETYVQSRVALIGDAAHVVHPLAGQGVNLGFHDAESLSQCISQAAQVGQDLGDLLTLESYDRQQRVMVNCGKMAGIHGLQRLFSVQDGPIALGRGIGLDLVNSVPFIKNKLATMAMGR
eukprot:TRINITY_DN2269_c0_g1_i1.p1 TRINITY_DN2269_c0_g1~~TRINITY_DN2269_c0_g1_i1.p1  ORF type:complete len:459 (+),score=109.85 TRINITY_DN2269_c0_g1_i1:101-1477(+)